jgi:hypothetical protein
MKPITATAMASAAKARLALLSAALRRRSQMRAWMLPSVRLAAYMVTQRMSISLKTGPIAWSGL